jgi:hypothetical protein
LRSIDRHGVSAKCFRRRGHAGRSSAFGRTDVAATIQAAYVAKAKQLHPDAGGSHTAMAEREMALKEIRA